MKIATLFLLTFVTTQALCKGSQLILSGTFPLEYKNIHRKATLLQEERMIAESFEFKKKQKLTFLENLRGKLNAGPGFDRF
jgi:hypothetical protein